MYPTLAECLGHIKSVNLQYIMLGCLDDATNESSTKSLMFQVLFFWAHSIFFEHSQIVWSWSNARFYLINLHIWAWSKNIWTSRWIRHKCGLPMSVILLIKIPFNFWSAVIRLRQHKVKILHRYLVFKRDQIGSAKITEEPAKAERNLPNLVLRGIWQRSIQGTCQR